MVRFVWAAWISLALFPTSEAKPPRRDAGSALDRAWGKLGPKVEACSAHARAAGEWGTVWLRFRFFHGRSPEFSLERTGPVNPATVACVRRLVARPRDQPVRRR